MSIFTNGPQPVGQLLSKPVSIRRNVWVCMPVVRNVDIHMYAKCDKNIPYGSRVMDIFTNW